MIRTPHRVLLLLALSLLAACAAQAPAPEQPTPLAQAILPEAGKAATLQALIRSTFQTQYSATRDLYAPPPESMADRYLVELVQDTPTLYLARGVKTFKADGDGLAVGFQDGIVRVFGGRGCSSLALASGKPVELLAWHAASPVVASCAGDRTAVMVHDLKSCSQLPPQTTNSTITHLALSRNGAWLAAMDEVQRLWMGSPQGPFAPVAPLRFITLDMTYTPQEGLLLVLDQAGWITVWSSSARALVDQFQIPDGPFAEGRFDGVFAEVKNFEGKVTRFDVAQRRKVNARVEPERFLLKDGVLTYRMQHRHYVKRVALRAPKLEVRQSPSTGLIRVDDLDGQSRLYEAATGRVSGRSPAPSDWTPVELGLDGDFVLGDKRYAVADAVFQTEHLRLMCRNVPGRGFFLWWVKTPRPQSAAPPQGALPTRESILADAPLAWTPIEPSGDVL